MLTVLTYMQIAFFTEVKFCMNEIISNLTSAMFYIDIKLLNGFCFLRSNKDSTP